MIAEQIYSAPSVVRIKRRSVPFVMTHQTVVFHRKPPHIDYMIALLLTSIATTFLVTLAAATNGMFHGNDEWGVISTCALGGCFGSVVGVFFALFAKPTEWKWHLFGIRWSINFCTSTFCGPIAYWWLFPKYFTAGQPSPILAIACGGVIGALGILLFQPLIPWIQRFLQNRFNKFDNQ